MSDATDTYLAAYQNAFRTELDLAVRWLCRTSPGRVLDCPCGDGFYTALFASHLGPGRVVAADCSPDCLRRAGEAVPPGSVEFVPADAYALPFSDGAFDLVWCAQSFITLDDPVRALRELGRVTRDGGVVAVLETDEYHHVILPWPVELELAVYRAMRAESKVRFGSGGKFAQARRLRAAFLEAGLKPAGRRTVVADRSAPFGPAEREFLSEHLGYLRKFVRPELTPREFEQLEGAADPSAEDGFFRRADGELTCLAAVCIATKGDLAADAGAVQGRTT